MGCAVIKPKSSILATTKALSVSTLSLNQNLRTSAVRSTNRKNTKQKGLQILHDRKKLSLEENELNGATLEKRSHTSKEKSEMRATLMHHFLFSSLPIKGINVLLTKCSLYSYEAESIVFTQNSNGNFFYLISAGSVEVIVNGIRKSTISKGGYFGELALLHDTLRTATVRTLAPTQLWVLSREDFKSAVQTVITSKYIENKQFLEGVHFFQILTPPQKEAMLGLLVLQEFEPGAKILLEGDPGEIFYIIKKGTVSCSTKGQELRKLSSGDFFGEQAVIYSTKRTATVTAVTKVSVLSLGADDLTLVFESKLQDIIYKNSQRIAMERSSVFRYFTKAQMEACIHLMKIVSFGEGEQVFTNGEVLGDKAIFVVKGCLKGESVKLGLFSCIGDVEMRGEASYFVEDWVAGEDTTLAVIDKLGIEKCIGGDISTVIASNELLQVLRSVHLLRTLSLEKLKSLTSVLKVSSFIQGSLIFQQGDPGDSFFIVKEGQVDIIKDKIPLRTISKDDFFGERSIIFNESRTATVIAKEDCSCWVLTKNDFLGIIDEGIRKHIMKRIELQNDSIILSDLVLVKLVGQGMFGKVFMVYNSKNNVYYALKTVARWKVHEFNIFDNIVQERKILLQLDHPMMMKLVKTFKDDSQIYFLMEYVQGTDLFDVLREISIMDEEKSIFYSACLLIILQYLHERRILYRDLKPENIMIDEEGYPKLIDFGTAIVIENRTYTIVGTPHYMAPEVIKGTGYGIEADLWSLGIMLYEFMFYSVPFAEHEKDTYKIYRIIQEEPLTFPNVNTTPAFINLLEKILNKNPVMRGNHDDIMKHSWYLGLNWDKLLAKELSAPYKPSVDDSHQKIPANNFSTETIQQQIERVDCRDPKLPLKFTNSPLFWDHDF